MNGVCANVSPAKWVRATAPCGSVSKDQFPWASFHKIHSTEPIGIFSVAMFGASTGILHSI